MGENRVAIPALQRLTTFDINYESVASVTSENVDQVYLAITSQPVWIASLAVSTVIIFTNLWIAAAFLLHAKTSDMLKKRSGRDMNGGLVFRAALCAVCLPLVRYFETQAVIWISLDPDNDLGCEIARDLSFTGMFLALVPIYGFLWTRQRAFYGHPSIGHMFNKCIERMSQISIAVVFLSGVIAISIALFPKEYESGPTGCVLISGHDEYSFRPYVYGFCFVMNQVILLFLFIYPLRVHSKTMKASKNSMYMASRKPPGSDTTETAPQTRVTAVSNTQCEDSAGKSPDEDFSQGGNVSTVYDVSYTVTSAGNDKHDHRMRKAKKKVKKNRVYDLIRRTTILTCICAITDVIGMAVIAKCLPRQTPQSLIAVLYDISIFTNVIAVLASFPQWKNILTCKSNKTRKSCC